MPITEREIEVREVAWSEHHKQPSKKLLKLIEAWEGLRRGFREAKVFYRSTYQNWPEIGFFVQQEDSETDEPTRSVFAVVPVSGYCCVCGRDVAIPLRLSERPKEQTASDVDSLTHADKPNLERARQTKQDVIPMYCGAHRSGHTLYRPEPRSEMRVEDRSALKRGLLRYVRYVPMTQDLEEAMDMLVASQIEAGEENITI